MDSLPAVPQFILSNVQDIGTEFKIWNQINWSNQINVRFTTDIISILPAWCANPVTGRKQNFYCKTYFGLSAMLWQNSIAKWLLQSRLYHLWGTSVIHDENSVNKITKQSKYGSVAPHFNTTLYEVWMTSWLQVCELPIHLCKTSLLNDWLSIWSLFL